VRLVNISSYVPEQPVTVTIEFKNKRKVHELLDDLMQWSPTGGWSELAKQFFEGLRVVNGNQ
jgi:hypothetical protein